MHVMNDNLQTRHIFNLRPPPLQWDLSSLPYFHFHHEDKMWRALLHFDFFKAFFFRARRRNFFRGENDERLQLAKSYLEIHKFSFSVSCSSFCAQKPRENLSLPFFATQVNELRSASRFIYKAYQKRSKKRLEVKCEIKFANFIFLFLPQLDVALGDKQINFLLLLLRRCHRETKWNRSFRVHSAFQPTNVDDFVMSSHFFFHSVCCVR